MPCYKVFSQDRRLSLLLKVDILQSVHCRQFSKQGTTEDRPSVIITDVIKEQLKVASNTVCHHLCHAWQRTRNEQERLLCNDKHNTRAFALSLSHKASRAGGIPIFWRLFILFAFSALPSVLWHCWLGGRKGIQPVKNLSSEVLAWLSVWSEVQTCIRSSWCHCRSLSLAPVKSRLVLPFWYRLTWVVPDKGPLNGCVCVLFCLQNSFVWCSTKYNNE